MNDQPETLPVRIGISGKVATADLPPNSLNTISLQYMDKNAKHLQSTERWLGFLGLIPFVSLAFLVWVEGSIGWLSSDQIHTLFLTYSAIILSFLSGTLWGFAMRTSEATSVRTKLLVASNVFSLLAWASLVGTHYTSALCLLMLGYILVLLKEHCISQLLPESYRPFRRVLTGVVLAAHASLLAAMLI